MSYSASVISAVICLMGFIMKSFARKLLLVLCFCSLCLSVQSQNGKMDFDNPEENFYDTQKRLNRHFKKYEKELARERKKEASGKLSKESEEEEEESGYEIYKRWEHYMAPRVYPSGDKTLPSRAYEEYQNYISQNAQQRQFSSTQSSTWQAMGPFGDPAGGNAGRVSTVRFDPSNANGIWVCTPDGGLWNSTNNGGNWTTNTDQLSVIGNTDVVFDPTNSQIMYMATGEGDHSDTYSTGVLKSTDGGATWNTTGLAWTVTQGRVIHKMLINPLNKNVLLVASSAGIYRTTNGGTTWAVVQAGNFTDMEYKPGDTTTVYGVTTTFYRSTNGGASFSATATGLPSSFSCDRLSIAVTPANPAYVYVVAGNTSAAFLGLYQSTNSGGAFTTKSTSPNILGYSNTGSDASGQAWYTLAIAASPTNANEILVGGVNIWKSTNGGSNWTLFSHWTGSGAPFVHADCHDIEYKNANTIYAGTDGGIFYTSDGGASFSSLNANMNIAQIYKIGLSKNTYSLVIAGHQDNGSNKFTSAGWSNVRGGDGMDCFVDWNNDQVMYASYVNGVLYRTTNGGTNWATITPASSGSGAWETPWHQDPATASTIYAGYTQMWKSTNQGTSWAQMGTLPGSSQIAEFAVAPSNNQVIYVIQGNTLIKTTNGGTSWSNITGTLPTGSAQLSWVSVEDDDPSSVWVTFSGYSSGNKVFKSTDGGSTWVNYSTGLPNLPTNCITYWNGTKDGLYVGCDVGVYYRDSTMASWTSYNTGLPRVSVHDLAIFYPGSKIRAATFGRGVWEADLYSTAQTPNAAFSASATKCTGQNITFTDQSTNSPTSWSWTFSGGTPVNSTQQNPTVSFASAGTHTITLTATNAAGTSTPSTQTITVLATPTITVNSPTVCAGSSATLTASGGTTYSWSTSAATNTISVAPASTTVYTVTGTSSGCSSAKTSTVTITPNPTVAVNSPTVCAGSSAVLTASGATTYSWSTSAATNTISVTPSGTTVYTVTGTSAGCSSAKTSTVTVTPNPTVTVNSATVCAGSSATLTASGGTTYSWSTSATTNAITVTPTSTTIYTVTGTSSGCSSAKTSTVTITPNPTVTVNSATVCAGSSAVLTANGATTYSWNTSQTTNTISVTPASSTVYTVTGGALGCYAATTATVEVNPLPAVTVNSASICAGASVMLTANGATTYSWSTSVTTNTISVSPASTTIYTVTGTTAGCSSENTATVTVVPNPTITVNSQTICAGDMATLTASGASTYSWSNGATGSSVSVSPASTTVYSVTGTSGSCNSSCTSTVSVNALPDVQVNSDTICIGSSTVLSAFGASTYTWSPSAGLSATSGASVVASPTITTTYSVAGTDGNSCVKTVAALVVVETCTGIRNSTGPVFLVYPNPANNKLYIEAQRNGNVKLVDALGQNILELPVSLGKSEIDITNLAAGIYFLNVQMGDGQRLIKLIKE